MDCRNRHALAVQLRPFIESDEDAEWLVGRYRTYQREHHDKLVTAYDGVLDTLEQLYNWGHPMGVVTSKSNEMMDRALKLPGFDVYMKTTIGFDSCALSKPDPPVLMALGELGYEPHEAVFVGDSPHDIKSGNAAGVRPLPRCGDRLRATSSSPTSRTSFWRASPMFPPPCNAFKQAPLPVEHRATAHAL